MSSYCPLSDVVSDKHTPWNNIYQSAENVKMSMAPVIKNTSIRNELASDRMDSVTTVHLPQNVLLSNSILVLTIAKEDLKQYLFMEKGWGYLALDKIVVQVAGSGQTLESRGASILVKNLSDSESQGKLDRVVELAGESFKGTADATKDYTAYINLANIPWSSCSSKRFLPYDSSILRSPASVRIELSPPRKFIKQSIGNTTQVPLPTRYKSAFVFSNTQILREPSPLPLLYGAGTNARYVYNYIYSQYEQQQGIRGKSDDNDHQTVQLRGFRSANLQSVDVWLTRETFDADTPMNNSRSCSLLSYAPRNLRLMYGGQELYRSELDTAQLSNLFDNEINLSWSTDNPAWAVGDNEALVSTPKASSYVHIPIAQFNETVFCDLVQQGVNFVSQDVTLEFNSPPPAELSPTDPGANEPKYTINFNYNYLAGVSTRNGETTLDFRPPKVMTIEQ